MFAFAGRTHKIRSLFDREAPLRSGESAGENAFKQVVWAKAYQGNCNAGNRVVGLPGMVFRERIARSTRQRPNSFPLSGHAMDDGKRVAAKLSDLSCANGGRVFVAGNIWRPGAL